MWGRERGEMGTTSVHASVSGWGERKKVDGKREVM
jgi:hypothetical protein